jgi:hypothetical protein
VQPTPKQGSIITSTGTLNATDPTVIRGPTGRAGGVFLLFVVGALVQAIGFGVVGARLLRRDR